MTRAKVREALRRDEQVFSVSRDKTGGQFSR